MALLCSGPDSIHRSTRETNLFKHRSIKSFSYCLYVCVSESNSWNNYKSSSIMYTETFFCGKLVRQSQIKSNHEYRIFLLYTAKLIYKISLCTCGSFGRAKYPFDNGHFFREGIPVDASNLLTDYFTNSWKSKSECHFLLQHIHHHRLCLYWRIKTLKQVSRVSNSNRKYHQNFISKFIK